MDRWMSARALTCRIYVFLCNFITQRSDQRNNNTVHLFRPLRLLSVSECAVQKATRGPPSGQATDQAPQSTPSSQFTVATANRCVTFATIDGRDHLLPERGVHRSNCIAADTRHHSGHARSYGGTRVHCCGRMLLRCAPAPQAQRAPLGRVHRRLHRPLGDSHIAARRAHPPFACGRPSATSFSGAARRLG